MNGDDSTKYPTSAEEVVANLIELFRLQKNHSVCEILENARAQIEETGYDGFNGGQYYFALLLELPMSLFARVEADTEKFENQIAKKFSSVFGQTGNVSLTEAKIRPILEKPKTTFASKVAQSEVEHLWKPGMVRVFLSHISAKKIGVSKLKSALHTYGVDSFVAHEDIEPTREWQKEIELALGSMHALVALLTPGFHESNWTDQEVGIAIGKGIIVIPVRLGIDPYGFIGKHQGLPGRLDLPEELASDIVDLLLKHRMTSDSIREAMVSRFERARSFKTAIEISKKIELLPYVSTTHLRRLEQACTDNSTVRKSWNVPERIKGIVERFEPQTKNEPTF